MPTVAKRGGAIIAARGQSSAASAAAAALDHVKSWHHGTPENDWVSMAIPSEQGDYGITDNLIFSYPVRIKDGQYEVVSGLEPNDFYSQKIRATEAELVKERSVVADLLAG
jgi:malate dehydrogenase